MIIAFETYDSIPLPIIQSEFLELRNSAVSGRGVFAAKDLLNGSNLQLNADSTSPALDNKRDSANYLQACTKERKGCSDHPNLEPLSPTAHVIFRAYRKEVCGECFRYDRGREWKMKLLVENGGGLVFCSEQCRIDWTARYGKVGIEAFSSLEAVTRRLNKRHGGVDVEDSNVSAAMDSSRTESLTSIRQKWDEARQAGQQIIAARSKRKPSKAEKTILRRTLEPDEIDLDIPYYLLTGVLSASLSAGAQKTITGQTEDGFTNASTSETTSATITDGTTSSRRTACASGSIQDATNLRDASFDVEALLPSLLTLAPDAACYSHPASSLPTFTRAYLLLFAVLPLPLLQFLTPQLAHELNSRASHNAFSIRPSGFTDGEQSGEFMGWGVWPSASFFNHSCRSNVAKVRVGRQWRFESQSSPSPGCGLVKMGTELCITYLGGDEHDLDVTQRRKRLLEGWGFHCNCLRCVEEANDGRNGVQD